MDIEENVIKIFFEGLVKKASVNSFIENQIDE